jgi:hypothetical protein
MGKPKSKVSAGQRKREERPEAQLTDFSNRLAEIANKSPIRKILKKTK